jgi:cell division protein FtsQ
MRRAVLPAAVLAVGMLLWPSLRDAVRRHPYFTVTEVAVRGARHLAPDTVRRLAGIEPGVGIWAVDCEHAERSLEGVAWVRAARVTRQLPGRIVIRVREERPAAIIALADAAPALHYVAPRGKIFARLESSDPRDLPYVTGLRARDLSGDARGLHAVRRALVLLRLASRRGPVSEILVHPVRGLTLLPVAPRIPVDVGWSDFARRLDRLAAVLERVRGREAEVARIRLVFDDEVVVEPRTAPARRARQAA